MPENSLNIFGTQLKAQTVWTLLPFIKLLNTTRTMDFKHLAHAISREFETATEQSSAFVDEDIVWLARMVTKKGMVGLYPDMVGTVEDGEFFAKLNPTRYRGESGSSPGNSLQLFLG